MMHHPVATSPSTPSSQTKENGTKRKAGDENGPTKAQTHTRSKRSRYISIACTECKRRKIKCNGHSPCERCEKLSLECLYVPNCCSTSFKDSEEYNHMKDEISQLQNQVRELYNICAGYREELQSLRSSTSIWSPSEFQRGEVSVSRILPPPTPTVRTPRVAPPVFHGPTSSAYGFDVARGSLQALGIAQVDQETLSTIPSRAPSPPQMAPMHPQKDPMWRIDEQEALRLVRFYEEEIQIMYPIVNVPKLQEYVHQLFRFINSARTSTLFQPTLPGEDSLSDEKTTQLKLVLAIALVMEGHGTSQLGQQFFESAKSTSEQFQDMAGLSLKAIVLVLLTAIYLFQHDDEQGAYQWCGMAVKQCQALGLHQKDTLLKTPRDNDEGLQHAIRVFWVIHALDRRWSFGTGLPLSMQDTDIDVCLPEPDNSFPYLKQITAYNKISSKIWKHVWDSNSGHASASLRDDTGFLNYQICTWYENLPPTMQFDGFNLSHPHEKIDRKLKRLRFLMFLRRNQAQISIYRPILHSATSIANNRELADLAVNIAKSTIITIIHVDQNSDIYRTQQVCYNYFLVQAIAVIFLAVVHQPAAYMALTRKEFYNGIDMIRNWSERSSTTHRMWKAVKNLKSYANKVRDHANKVQHQPHQSPMSMDDIERRAAMTMADMRRDSAPNTFNRTPSNTGIGMDLHHSPEDFGNPQMISNDLRNLFEMAGTSEPAGMPFEPGYVQEASPHVHNQSFASTFGTIRNGEFNRIMEDFFSDQPRQ